MAKTYTSRCYFCHSLKLTYAPVERATRLEANVDWHRHVLDAHANFEWVIDNETTVREFIAANESGGSDHRCAVVGCDANPDAAWGLCAEHLANIEAQIEEDNADWHHNSGDLS